MTTLDFLNSKFKEVGDFRVMVAWNKEGQHEINKTKWKSFRSLAPALQRRIFLREVFSNEVLFDLDYPRAEAARQAKSLLEWLRAQHLTCESWFTGSKGQHVQIVFPEMLTLTDKQRIKIRKWFFERIKCKLGIKVDVAKQSGMVAVEGAPHFKNVQGKPFLSDLRGLPKKTLSGAYRFSEQNKLPQECLSFALTEPPAQNYTTSAPTLLTKEDFIKHPFIQHLRKNIFPKNGKRHRVLLKNIAVLCVEAKLSDQEVMQFANEIRPNIPDSDNLADGLLGWVRWIRA